MATESAPANSETPVTTQVAQAILFRELHHRPDMLVLPNVWDVGGAVLVSQVAGVQAIATTSAGIAAAAGFGDGEHLGLDRLLDLVGQITRATRLPVSVDLESGYGRTAEEVGRSVAAIIEAGAVGVNLEDAIATEPGALLDSDAHAERIAAAREAADRLGVPIVVNARTDVYWRSSGPAAGRFAETLRRLRIYAAAGADCVFVPGFPGPATADVDQHAAIGELVQQLGGVPVNLLADPGLPSIADLRALGVRRLSTGSALYRLSMAAVLDAVSRMTDSRMTDGRMTDGRKTEGRITNGGSLDALRGAQRLAYPDLADALARAGSPLDSARSETR